MDSVFRWSISFKGCNQVSLPVVSALSKVAISNDVAGSFTSQQQPLAVSPASSFSWSSSSSSGCLLHLRGINQRISSNHNSNTMCHFQPHRSNDHNFPHSEYFCWHLTFTFTSLRQHYWYKISTWIQLHTVFVFNWEDVISSGCHPSNVCQVILDVGWHLAFTAP